VPCQIRVTLPDSEDRSVEIIASYSPPTPDVFYLRNGDPGHPGDPEEIEVISARALDEGANVAEVEADTDAIEEAVRQAADDAAEDYDDPDDD
jgi:hypothetical protein